MYGSESIKVDWVREKNFGDVLNPILIEGLTGKKVDHVVPIYYEEQYVSAIGSILDRSRKNTVVWGSGFIKESSSIRERPRKICAVRGPETRRKLIEMGIDCPEIYGDPALLLPLVYSPSVDKKYKIGIVAHYVDLGNEWLRKYTKSAEVKIINPINADPLQVVNQILACEYIISSSLHGLIVADAYGVPNRWIELSNRVIGEGFKFRDYFASVSRDCRFPVRITADTDIDSVIKGLEIERIKFNSRDLLDASPFRIIV
ncbi:MAG: polysaccharide pyruvyl transferase family protein [Gammaproteobacteria bacterium]|nr:polysaccharide pyruvyl transferase family protein [Gammaproteobacteria bacterium]